MDIRHRNTIVPARALAPSRSVHRAIRDYVADTQTPEPPRHPESDETPLFIWVVTRSTVNPDEPPRRQRINYHNDRSRKWLITHQFWALHHGYSVMTHVDGE